MNYDEYYNMIINIFYESIKVEDLELHNKVLDALINWYKKNYEMLLKKHFENEDEGSVVALTKEIKQVCNLNDYEKIQQIYECKQLDELNELSTKIFELIKQMKKNNNITFDQNEYKKILDKFNKIEEDFPNIIIDKFKNIKSECLLDLEFLLKKGNVENYSFRTYNYLQLEK